MPFQASEPTVQSNRPTPHDFVFCHLLCERWLLSERPDGQQLVGLVAEFWPQFSEVAQRDLKHYFLDELVRLDGLPSPELRRRCDRVIAEWRRASLRPRYPE